MTKTEKNLQLTNFFFKTGLEQLKVHIKTHNPADIQKAEYNISSKPVEYTIFLSQFQVQLEEKRNAWYDLLESENFNPSFEESRGVCFFSNYTKEQRTDKNKIYAQEVKYQIIEELVSEHIGRIYKSTEKEEAEKKKISILEACKQVSRYLPEFEERNPHYFVDTHRAKIGVIFQNNGTLTLLIGETSEVEFTYAQKLESGTTRITGTAKLTKHLKNSKNIWKILNLQGRVE